MLVCERASRCDFAAHSAASPPRSSHCVRRASAALAQRSSQARGTGGFTGRQFSRMHAVRNSLVALLQSRVALARQDASSPPSATQAAIFSSRDSWQRESSSRALSAQRAPQETGFSAQRSKHFWSTPSARSRHSASSPPEWIHSAKILSPIDVQRSSQFGGWPLSQCDVQRSAKVVASAWHSTSALITKLH